tara:strand:- start:9852 stop:10094 length:243 start_codon:yes stop_codon:yes gene_type:complete
VGYNSNQSNFDIVDLEGERELIVANDLRRDGDQFFVKFSYLFQRWLHIRRKKWQRSFPLTSLESILFLQIRHIPLLLQLL